MHREGCDGRQCMQINNVYVFAPLASDLSLLTYHNC